MHMILDGYEWRSAIARHKEKPDEDFIRQVLSTYQNLGYTYLRDGGDRWDAGKRSREIAEEYGITYRTPLAPLCKKGHYGAFIGLTWENFREYRDLVVQHRENGADFIKIMISGLMDFDHYGVLTEEGLAPEEIRELIHIAHEEGFSVMSTATVPERPRRPRKPVWTVLITVPIWIGMPCRPWRTTVWFGCPPFPRSETCGVKAASTRMLSGKF